MRPLVHLTPVVVCLLVSSCKPEQTNGYDRLKVQLLTEAFDAVKNRDHELAISRLGKLPQSEFVGKMIKRQQEGLALENVQTLVVEGEFQKALTACEAGIVQCGRSGQLPDVESQLKALIAIQTFKKGLPYETSAAYKKALIELPLPVDLDNDPQYVGWLNSHRKQMLNLQAKEREILFRRSLARLDSALLRGRDIGEAFAALKSADSTHPLLTAWQTRDVHSKDLSSAERERLVLALYRSKLASVERSLLPVNAETKSGELLAVARQFRDGDGLGGLKALTRLTEQVSDLDTSPVAPLIRVILKGTPTSLAPTDLAGSLLRIR